MDSNCESKESALFMRKSENYVEQEINHQKESLTISDDLNVTRRGFPTILSKYFPPRGYPAKIIIRVFTCFSLWAALYVVIGVDALPEGNIFSIYVLFICALSGGFLLSWGSLPPLLGMLVAGFLLRNVPYISVAKNIDKDWSSVLKSIALGIILLRSGLGLDLHALRRLKCTVIRLAFLPCIGEAVTVAIAAYLILGMPWLWGFQLGFILGAVSPAVVVPSMLILQKNGYGVNEGIPTMVMAASSCDDVLAISMFSIFLGVAFSEGNLYFNIFRGPLEILMGLFGGFVAGFIFWYLPAKKAKGLNAYRSFLLIICGIIILFGSNKVKFPGAGALGALCMATTAGYGWDENEKASVEKVLTLVWEVFQPLMFGLIGAEVGIEYLDKTLVGRGFAALFIGLVVRTIIVFFVVSGNNLNFKEKCFCTLAWLPKATVQAAIGSLPLDMVRQHALPNKSKELIGIQILTIAVLAIVVTAPLGAVLISFTGPKWLKIKAGNNI